MKKAISLLEVMIERRNWALECADYLNGIHRRDQIINCPNCNETKRTMEEALEELNAYNQEIEDLRLISNEPDDFVNSCCKYGVQAPYTEFKLIFGQKLYSARCTKCGNARVSPNLQEEVKNESA